MVQTMKYMIAAGDRFGDWLVIQPYASTNRWGRAMALCHCTRCGEVERHVLHYDLGRGVSRGCNCLNHALLRTGSLKHGHGVHEARSLTYKSWKNLLRRYGDRVCIQWREDFMQFVADVGERPNAAHHLRVINTSLPILPFNVRWEVRRRTTIPKNVTRAKRRVQEAEARKAAQQATAQ